VAPAALQSVTAAAAAAAAAFPAAVHRKQSKVPLPLPGHVISCMRQLLPLVCHRHQLSTAKQPEPDISLSWAQATSV
jgi:hypothetical protein